VIGLLGEGEAELAEPEAGAAPRARVGRHLRKEAVEHDRLDLVAPERRHECAADDRPAAARHRHAHLGERRVGQQPLLRRAALGDKRVEALRVELSAARDEPRLHLARERHVDVVAAEQQVLAHGDALEAQLSPAGAGGDEREVGRAAAHVDDQDERVCRDARAPVRLVSHEPGVEGGLRLLQQHHVREPCRPRGGERQLARHLVEGGGHGEDDVLLGQRRGETRVPRLAHVSQAARRGLDGRHAGHVVGRAPGEDRRRAVDGGVAEPRLGRGDEPTRDARQPCRRANSPTAIARSSSHGRRVAPAGSSWGPGR
jgi:hypothetical protein